MFHVESSALHLFEARRLTPIFDNTQASFKISKRLLFAKTFASRKEEFYFKKSHFCSEIYFCRFKEGVLNLNECFARNFTMFCLYTRYYLRMKMKE